MPITITRTLDGSADQYRDSESDVSVYIGDDGVVEFDQGLLDSAYGLLEPLARLLLSVHTNTAAERAGTVPN